MKRNTLIILGIFIVALVVFFVARRPVKEPPAVRLDLPAIRADDTPRDDEPEGAVGPPKHIEIQRKGVSVVLERSAAGEWEIKAPVSSLAQAYRVKSMLRAFSEITESSLGREVGEDELRHYGLGEDRRIRVTMQAAGEVLLDLQIGDSMKVDDSGTRDTNVMIPETHQVFRVRGQDLRGPFDVDLEDLQDKKIFRFKKDAIARLVITDPRGEGDPLVLVRGGEGTQGWSSPSNKKLRVASMDTYCSTLAGLTATKMAAELPVVDAAALSQTYQIEVTADVEGAPQVAILELGAGRGAVWARLKNRSGVFQVSTGSAGALMKSVSEFRDKKLFLFDKEGIHQIKVTNNATRESYSLERHYEKWIFDGKLDTLISTGDANRMAAAVAALRTQEFVLRPLEGTGLEAPRQVLKIISGDVNDLQVNVLEIGDEIARTDEKEPKRFWARLDGAPELLQLADYSVTALRKSRADLLDKRIFPIEASSIQSVWIRYPDVDIQLVRKEDHWEVAAPEVIVDPRGVEEIVQTLADLKVKTMKPDLIPENMRFDIGISFMLGDGTDRQLMLSEEVDEGGNYALCPDHTGLSGNVFTISQYKVANLLKKLPDLRPETK